jgi:hypothetical protein
MAVVVAAQSGRAGGRSARGFDEQVDRRRAAEHLDAVGTKPTTDCQPESCLVEVSRAVEIVHINVYQDLQGVLGGAQERVGEVSDSRSQRTLMLYRKAEQQMLAMNRFRVGSGPSSRRAGSRSASDAARPGSGGWARLKGRIIPRLTSRVSANSGVPVAQDRIGASGFPSVLGSGGLRAFQLGVGRKSGRWWRAERRLFTDLRWLMRSGGPVRWSALFKQLWTLPAHYSDQLTRIITSSRLFWGGHLALDAQVISWEGRQFRRGDLGVSGQFGSGFA